MWYNTILKTGINLMKNETQSIVSSTKKPNLFFYEYAHRLITKLTIKNKNRTKTYPFYQSTGVNSQYRGTWFPFKGIENNGFFLKPHSTKNQRLHLSYDSTFVDFLEEHRHHVFQNGIECLMIRFGNTECMLVSYLIGGGYWDTEDSFLIKQFIKKNYPHILEKLKESCPDMIEIQNPIRIEKLELGVKNQKKINDFLRNTTKAVFKTNFYTSVFDYSIPTPQEYNPLQLKIESLRHACEEYKTHLDKNYRLHPNDKLLAKKRELIDKLYDTLLKTHGKRSILKTFENDFHAYKDIFSQRRDSIGMLFVKTVLTILTFGLASYFGIWAVKGNQVNQNIEKILEEKNTPPRPQTFST